MPLSTNWNDVVAMHLHQLVEKPDAKVWFILIIDELTRFTAGQILTDKSAETIVKAVISSWVFRFGPSAKLHVDNGKKI